MVPPSTIFHLGHIIAEFGRSPAPVEHHHRHHAVVLTELIPNTLLDRSPGIVTELNVCRTRRCRTFGTWIGRIVKTYDYINCIVITFPLNGLRGYVDNTLPSRCYAINMILRVRRKILKLLRSPTVASEPGFMR